MFVLTEMRDTVKIQPVRFDVKLNEAIAEELNRRFANKVVLNIGLCIVLYDITKLEESYILPGDGASHTKVQFRLVVFRPFVDEIIVGKIKSSSQEGIHVSLGFFDDILIPPDALKHPSEFDEAGQLWIWKYEEEEGAEASNAYLELGEEIRFRITEEIFVDTTPVGPNLANIETTNEKRAPYTLIGSIIEAGLGLLTWWSSNTADPDESLESMT